MKKIFMAMFTIVALNCFSNNILASPGEGYMLNNGLKAILVPQENSPVVALRMVVKSGSAAENTYSEYGLAHLMEHMAFKGTKKFEDGEISKLIEDNGGDMNAYTSADETVYYLILPKEKIELGMEILSEMIFLPKYDSEEYKLEKEVVIEEIKRSLDTPDRLLTEEFFNLTYPNHPYGRPVIGFEDSVKNVTVEEAKAFHDKYYIPNNMFLVVTGGFDFEEGKKLSQKYFETHKAENKNKIIYTEPKLENRNKAEVKIIKNNKINLAKVLIGFNAPNYQDPQSPLLNLISTILSDNDASRLIENIKIDKNLVSYISAYAYSPKYQGSFIISFETDVDKVPDAFKNVLLEIENLFKTPPTDEEINRAIISAEKYLLNSQETASGFSSQIAAFEHFANDWRLKDAYVSYWKQADKKTLLKTMGNIFTKEKLSVIIMLPNENNAAYNEKDIIKIIDDYKKPEIKLENIKNEFNHFKLENGINLYVLQDKNLPKINIKVGALGGLIAETEKTNGLTNFMAKTWVKNPKGFSVSDFSRKTSELAADFSSFSGKNSVGLSADILTANWKESLELFCDVLQNPAFDEKNIETLKTEIIANIKAENENLLRKTMNGLIKNLYENHPYAYNILGTENNVKNFTQVDLISMHQELINPEDLVIVAIGDIVAEDLYKYLNSNLKTWKNSIKRKKVEFPAEAKALDFVINKYESIASAQTHLAVAYLVDGLGTDDEAALTVLNGYLSGMGGPLFRELRDKKSLASTVFSSYGLGLNNGYFMFYIASDPSKTETALKGMDEIIELIKTEGISAENLEGAKTYLIGQTQISKQTLSSRSSDFLFNLLYGMGLNYSDKQIENYKAVSQEDIKRVANKYFNTNKRVVVSVGSKEIK